MNRSRAASVVLLAAALTTLTACGPESPGVSSPTTSHDSTDRGPTTSPRPTSTPTASTSTSAPAPNPIREDSVRFLDLIPSVKKAQNAQGTFAFAMDSADQKGTGTARCHEPVAWQTTTARSEQIHVDGKEYHRDRRGGPDYRVTDDDDLSIDGNTPCNPVELVSARDRDGLVLSVRTRNASVDGRTNVVHLRGTASRSQTTYDFWLDESRRPVRLQIGADSRTQSITYRDYGKPVTITAPRNVSSRTSRPMPCGDTSAPRCADPTGDAGQV